MCTVVRFVYPLLLFKLEYLLAAPRAVSLFFTKSFPVSAAVVTRSVITK